MAAAPSEDEERGQVVSLKEYIEKAEEEEENADLVLGGDEGKECTYQEGSLVRQAVFSCLTCVPQGSAGVCTACSLVCHDGHEVVELWTKRKFRCDCGNSKFSAECKLWKDKDAENTLNAYGQNFVGLYCTCHRPYPNAEDEALGEMLQCCICEDWFHEAHLGLSPSEKVPRDEEGDPFFDELICASCADRCSVLSTYWIRHQSAEQRTQKSEVVEQEIKKGEAGCSGTTQCVLKAGQGSTQVQFNRGRAVFLDKGWRDELCKCDDCVQLYTSKGLSFLLECGDSMQDYETMAKQRRLKKMEVEKGDSLKFLQDMNHVAKVEFLHGVNDMTTELGSFFASFQEAGKTVTSADIYEFFEHLKKKRRRD